MSVLAHVYPANLTKKSWDKTKGTVAKLAGETGMGAAMEACEKGWKELKPDLWNPDVILYGPNGVHPDTALAAVKNEQAKIVKFRETVKKLVDTAKATAETFKKNKLIPKSSTENVEAIHKTADHWWIALKGDVFVQLCNEAKAALKAGEEQATLRESGRKEVATLLIQVKNILDAIEKNIPSGLAKLKESEKLGEDLAKLEKDALSGTGPIIKARGSLDTKHRDVFDKLSPALNGQLKKRAYDSFDETMRDFAQVRRAKTTAKTHIANQKLTAEKTTVPSLTDPALTTHVGALQEEVKSIGGAAAMPLTKIVQWDKLKDFATQSNWTMYDAKKNETIEVIPFVEALVVYLAALRSRVALIPEGVESAKKAKAEMLKAIGEMEKKGTDGLKGKQAFEDMVKECERLRK